MLAVFPLTPSRDELEQGSKLFLAFYEIHIAGKVVFAKP